jgi:hypothetical protein
VRFFDRAISQRGAILVTTICFFFSPARHLTRFSGTAASQQRTERTLDYLRGGLAGHVGRQHRPFTISACELAVPSDQRTSRPMRAATDRKM